MTRAPGAHPARRPDPFTLCTGTPMLQRMLLALLACIALAGPAPAQLSYDGTFFIHGLNEPDIWTYGDITGSLSQRVDLGARAVTPNGWDPQQTVDVQSREVAVRVDWYAGRDVFVGHSMGGVIVRNLVLSSDPSINRAHRVAGIVTSASPLRGAPIADKATVGWEPVSGKDIVNAFLDRLIFNARSVGALIAALASALIDVLVDKVISVLVRGLADVMNMDSPGAKDLSPSSPTIQRLQVGDAVPHASVYGTIPKKNAAIHMFASQRYDADEGMGLVRSKDVVLGLLFICKTLKYNIIIKTSGGRACYHAHRWIAGFDERWNDWTHGTNKRTPFDGLVPQDYSLYPGTSASSALNIRVDRANHFTLVWKSHGLDGTASGMKYIGMRPVGTSDPDDPDDPGCASCELIH